MSKIHIVISGNVGVGKSTIGPILSKKISAKWLPETAISNQFAHLFALENKNARVISQMAFSTLRVATILSSFQENCNVIVSERSLRDSLIFHKLWRKLYSLKSLDNFFDKFYSLLDWTPQQILNITIWLKCPVNILLQRIKLRSNIFKNNHTKKVIADLDRLYTESFFKNPPINLIELDTSLFFNSEEEISLITENLYQQICKIIQTP